MGADLDILIEHKIPGEPFYDERVSRDWTVVAWDGACYRGHTFIQYIREIPDVYGGLVERDLGANYKYRLPGDISDAAFELVEHRMSEAYWIRVAPGQWLVDFVASQPWRTTATTDGWGPEPDMQAPEPVAKAADLVSALLALGHEVRVYFAYGQ